MDRRLFVRIAGGGVVAAATAPFAGCAAGELPAEAVAPWQGPGAEADLRRWVLSYAILAPHSHNMQSWLVDLGTPGEIVLRCDLTRLLPETDPYSRQIVMSQGTFVELLAIAARERGHRAEVTPFPAGEFGPERPDSRPVAHIRLVPDAAAPKDPLFAQILHRRTNRSLYDAARPVPAAAWQAMAAATAGTPGLHFDHAAEPAALVRHRAIAAEAWRIELTTPRTILESLKVMRIGAAEVARHRDGLTLMDPAVVWANRLGFFDRSRAPAPDSYGIRSQVRDFDDKLASTPGFLWMVSDDNRRTTQFAAGRAYARVQLAATAHGVVMQPLQQALQEYPEQAGPYRDIRALLGAGETKTVQMWARVGHAPPVPPAPRRGLAAHLVRA